MWKTRTMLKIPVPFMHCTFAQYTTVASVCERKITTFSCHALWGTCSLLVFVPVIETNATQLHCHPLTSGQICFLHLFSLFFFIIITFFLIAWIYFRMYFCYYVVTQGSFSFNVMNAFCKAAKSWTGNDFYGKAYFNMENVFLSVSIYLKICTHI